MIYNLQDERNTPQTAKCEFSAKNYPWAYAYGDVVMAKNSDF